MTRLEFRSVAVIDWAAALLAGSLDSISGPGRPPSGFDGDWPASRAQSVSYRPRSGRSTK
jgi:hypothetical protein